MTRRGRPTPPIAPTASELRILGRWARGVGVSAAVAERARIVLACADGATHRAVARALDTSAHRVGRWCGRFARDGVAGLVDEPRPGARPRVDASAGARALAAIVRGETSTHRIARALGISQPTASRLRRELALDPFASPHLPAHLRLLDPATHRLTGLLLAGGQRVLLVRPAPATPPAPAGSIPSPPRGEAPPGRAPSLPLRRFLRRAQRLHHGPLHAVAHLAAAPGLAVRRLVAKSPWLTWHAVATAAGFERLLGAWLAFDGGRACDALGIAAVFAGAATWLAPPAALHLDTGHE